MFLIEINNVMYHQGMNQVNKLNEDPSSAIKKKKKKACTSECQQAPLRGNKHLNVPTSTFKEKQAPQSANKHLKVPTSTSKCQQAPQSAKKHLTFKG